ncbi:MAG: hypothetical protein F6J94_21630 [Moorea sp. SIO1F2]|uniref:hypothetical protein n=1 Tax=unclassified Moorena TaxID=2683338 RepID=UPI0013BBE6ED|nr:MULTISPECIES: hypothetical protein [unclassified Moorena]NEN97617.1 hypothetical protein [Moorena sp. SIO3I7]NEO09365.1 hypothetical protein [Moorena sp. SIO3I8]NEO21748.1 hypothetical protein [Moorena sp. SIO4A5]NEQ57623.1 hypothetical protein [Moorena sp. SIO4A1]NET84421.1 hypothetical protein [Moorena sp. SIO1F2]
MPQYPLSMKYSATPKSEVRSQKSEVRSQKSEVRSQKSAMTEFRSLGMSNI